MAEVLSSASLALILDSMLSQREGIPSCFQSHAVHVGQPVGGQLGEAHRNIKSFVLESSDVVHSVTVSECFASTTYIS